MWNKISPMSAIAGLLIFFAVIAVGSGKLFGESTFSIGNISPIFIFAVAPAIMSIFKKKKSKESDNNQENNHSDIKGTEYESKVQEEVICDYCGTINTKDALTCKKCNAFLK